ncbi:MAG: hypothetical protein U0527_07505 [Candidatus Eisenbacteria bacterium]
MEYETDNRHYAHVDCPERRLRQEHGDGSGADGRAILVVAGRTAFDASNARAHSSRSSGGRTLHRGLLNKVDMVDDPEILEYVEWEVQDLLKKYEFPGDDIPIVRGSALKAGRTRPIRRPRSAFSVDGGGR